LSQEVIKSAALKLFNQYSYVKTTVADIASVAGIGKGSIYLVYKTKDDILFSLIDDSIKEIKARYESWFLDDSVSLDEKIVTFSRIIIEQLFATRDLMFGSFENVEGREIQDIYNKFRNYFILAGKYLLKIIGNHGLPPTEARKTNANEFILFLLGRFIIYILGHDWNHRQDIYQLLPSWVAPMSHSLVLEESV
jgi:AcrR family transcriptional regulator